MVMASTMMQIQFAHHSARQGDVFSVQKEIVSVFIIDKVGSEMNGVSTSSTPFLSPPRLPGDIFRIQDHLATIWQNIRECWLLDQKALFSGRLNDFECSDVTSDPKVLLSFSEDQGWLWFFRSPRQVKITFSVSKTQNAISATSHKMFTIQGEIDGLPSSLRPNRVLILLSQEKFAHTEQLVGVTLDNDDTDLLLELLGRVQKLTLNKEGAVLELSNKVERLSPLTIAESFND